MFRSLSQIRLDSNSLAVSLPLPSLCYASTLLPSLEVAPNQALFFFKKSFAFHPVPFFFISTIKIQAIFQVKLKKYRPEDHSAASKNIFF